MKKLGSSATNYDADTTYWAVVRGCFGIGVIEHPSIANVSSMDIIGSGIWNSDLVFLEQVDVSLSVFHHAYNVT